MLKQNKGITLIALIITIIVMMILVAVSVTVALDGGLFGTAKDAASKTQIEAEKEMLLSAVVGAIGTNAKVDFNKLKENLPDGFKEENGIYISSSGNEFTVTDAGEIKQGWIDNGDGTYTKGNKTIKRGTTYTTDEVLEQLGLTKTEGKYEGNWEVIGVEGDKIKLVSAENVTNVILGYDDPKAKIAIPVTNVELTETEKYERSIWSYKNAINTVNTAVKNSTGISSAESIKIEDIYEIVGEENLTRNFYGMIYNFYYDTTNSKVCSKYKNSPNDEWSTEYVTLYTTQTCIDQNGETKVIDSEGDTVTLTRNFYSYKLSDNQKKQIGSLAIGAYWFASPYVWCSSELSSYGVFCISNGVINDPNGDLLGSRIEDAINRDYGVRAIILL